MHISIDFETTSCVDLRKAGAWRYAKDPSTRVIVIAWSINGGPVKSVAGNITTLPDEVREAIKAGAIIHAWNAGFEQAFLEGFFGLIIAPEQYSCTMQRALYAGLPGSLDEAGRALKLDVRKDKEGHALMMRMSRPRSTDPLRWWHEDDPAKLSRLQLYCEQDVRTELAIAAEIPELPDHEKLVSTIDRKANNHGVRIDRAAIGAMLDIANSAAKDLNAEITQISNGQVTNAGTQTAKLIAWLGEFAPPTLAKNDVTEALKRDDLPAHYRRALEIRQLVAKASVKKLNAMLNCVDNDDAVRGLLQYSGAGRTHRWAGRLIQVQNFPRPSIKKPEKAIDHIMRGIDLDGLRAFHGEPLDVVSSCLRGMLIPRPGYAFIDFDLSSIEARMVAWLAGQNDVLRVFERGEDVYVYTQKKLGLNSRQEGKVAVLGLGYGMGAAKFVATAAGYGLSFDDDFAQKIVSDWREANNKISSLWWTTDRCAKETIRAAQSAANKSARISVNSLISLSVRPARNGDPLLTIRLPSGNHLFYRNVGLEAGEKGDQIVYDGVDQTTKKWSRQRTYGGKLVENITQAAARDVIADMLMRIDATPAAGKLVTTVHDQILTEAPIADAAAACVAVNEIMNTAPAWANGCPIGAEGGVKMRFGK